MSFLVVFPWLIVAAGCWIGYQLIRQNGRVLLRLEALENRLAELGSQTTHAPTQQSPPAGLPIGSVAPDFELPELSAPESRKKLSSFKGQRVLLIFFNPRCGFCTRLLPQLVSLPKLATVLLIVTTGDAAENEKLFKEHNIHANVFLQDQMTLASKYQANGTPMGYLIDEQGRIASELAVGAEALLPLATDAAPVNGDGHYRTYQGNRTLGESKIERNGLKAGTPAPGFQLPRVDGGELSLEQYWGRKLLLVFSDPNCGPCNQLAPLLEKSYRAHPDVEVLMVSRGEVEANQAKIAEHKFTFPVVVQKQWEISRLYGMFATPIAYLIDEQGLIEQDVATGVDSILALLSRPAAIASNRPQPVPRS